MRSCGLILAAALIVPLAACRSPEARPPADEAASEAAASPSGSVVRVVAREYAFDAPAEVPSGWTTFQFENQGAQEHFMVLWKLPEGKTIEDVKNEVQPAFDLEPYASGELNREQYIERLVSLIPEWYGGVVSAGGVGLVSPGHASEATVLLEPGNYVMECYVKTADGSFHSMLGMLHPLTVSAERTGETPPEHDVELALKNYAITVEGPLTPGRHTARVNHADDPEGFVKHDVHLVRLDEGTEVADVVPWMDWIDALTSPAPAILLGGSEDQPGGSTSYFTFSLEPGRYAWVSEGYAAQGMVLEFAVE